MLLYCLLATLALFALYIMHLTWGEPITIGIVTTLVLIWCFLVVISKPAAAAYVVGALFTLSFAFTLVIIGAIMNKG
jgi:hypothetical protein